MDKETWRTYVEKYKGAFVVWVDQSTDSLLKAYNSKGVCFAMSIDFATAYQAGQPGPSNFVNDIRYATNRYPNKSRIPPKYIEIQAAAQAMFDEYKLDLELLQLELEIAEKDEKPAQIAKIKQFMDDRVKQQYGPGMLTYETFKEDNALASMEILHRIKANVAKNGPSYFLITMSGATSAHVISFGYRPDLSGSDKFPALYEFFDANLGFFVFPSEQSLSGFFNIEVWAEIYGNKDYSKFAITSYPAKKGKR
jgi:hypothetical protein